MSESEMQEFMELVDRGLKLAIRRMLEEKALRGLDIIVSDENHCIKRIPAKQVLEEMQANERKPNDGE